MTRPLPRRDVLAALPLTALPLAGLSSGAAASAARSGPAAVAASAAASSGFVSVTDHGATGDGVTDDTAAVQAAVDEAAGTAVVFPAGTFVLDGLVTRGDDRLMLSPGTTLLHRPRSEKEFMIGFAGSSLTIDGGAMDGNAPSQTGRPSLVAGSVQNGKRVTLRSVRVRRSVKAAVYADQFGGEISVTDCTFREQAEHDGTAGHWTAIVAVVGGEAGSRGRVSFTHNTAVGTDAPALPGGSPGGLFIGPVLTSTTGTLATVEAVGNSFWGYGQLCAGNYISPVHSYPSLEALRVIGNHFDRCGCSAVAAKSVQDLVCIGNVVTDGQVRLVDPGSPALGAISYAPGDFAADRPYLRAVIQGNIVSNPGGLPTRTATGIAVLGSTTARASQVVVSDNVLSGCAFGITVSLASKVLVHGNVVTSAATGNPSLCGGIRVDDCVDDVTISGNTVTNTIGHAVTAAYSLQAADVQVSGNTITQSAAGYYGLFVGGVRSASITGNTFRGTAGALTVRGSNGQKVGRLFMDSSDSVLSASPGSMRWAEITACYGSLSSTTPPTGSIVPGEVGTTCTYRNGTAGSVLWVATGTTATSWKAVG